MSRSKKQHRHHPNRGRRLRVRGVRRGDPDLKRLGRALIELATAEAEAAAQQDHEQRTAVPPDADEPTGSDGEAA